MSQAILKKCLEIVEADLIESDTKNAKKKPKNQQKNSIFDMIPEKKRLVIKTKTGKYPHTPVISHKSLKSLDLIQSIVPFFSDKVNKIKKVEKPTVKQAQNRLKRAQDRTEENVRRLLALDVQTKLNDETKDLMIKRARSNHYVVPEKIVKEEEDVFTEEDFLKFEKEYFFK